MALRLAQRKSVVLKFVGDGDVIENSKNAKQNYIDKKKIKGLSGKIALSKHQAKNIEKKGNDVLLSKTSKYSLRARIKQELVSLRNEKVDSDPEDIDDGGDSWCDESGTDDEAGDVTLFASNSKKKSFSLRSHAEDYFFAHKQSKAVTSDRTLSKLQFRKSDIKEIEKIYRNASEIHKKEAELMLQNYCSLFEKWIFLLSEGFNVLLYGIGSKHGILQKFAAEFLEHTLYITVHGFFPSVSVKQILCSITEDALEHRDTFSNIYDHVDFIKQYFSSGEEELYIIVHNIDGTALRGMKNQSVLSMLAAIPHVHFLASVDHINSPLIWDQINFSHFNWIWYDVSTFEPYIIETSFDNFLLNEQSDHLVLSSLLHVFRSLTPNGQGVFMLLAKEQLEEKGNSSYLGITFHEWYQKCRESFLVNSELTMQAQLTEFKDHKLLLSRKSSSGVEYLYIPVDSETLEQFLEKENS